MSFRSQGAGLDTPAGPFRRALRYAFYDWTREMPKRKRLFTFVALLMQGYAVYAVLMWALMVPKGLLGY